MNHDMHERLGADPGGRTIGELIQERQWAYDEIARLYSGLQAVGETHSRQHAFSPSSAASIADATTRAAGERLLRIGQLCEIVGISRSMIYKMISERRFPAGVVVSQRARRWRESDVASWQASLRQGSVRRNCGGV